MRITLVIYSLSAGGAERVLSLLAKGFIEREHQVSIITIEGIEHDFYPLPSEVNRIALNLAEPSSGIKEAISNNFYLISSLRKGILGTSPDIVISFMDKTNALTVLSLYNTKIPVIITEHNDPETMPIGRLWSWIRSITYPHACKLVSVSLGVDKYFSSWIKPDKRVVIYNPVDIKELGYYKRQIKNDPFTILSMGRLIFEKGFDILVKAFAQLKRSYPNSQLIILGEGNERNKLENLIKDLNLEDSIHIPGRLKDPFQTLKNADVFVLPSRTEGFGNVLIEAMACGVPVISTNCPGGPREIIMDGETGILVETENADHLTNAIKDLLDNANKRKFLAENALTSINKFDLQNIIDSWEEVINDCLGRNN